MTKREEQFREDLCNLIAKHHDWIEFENWMRACNEVGSSYFGEMAHHYAALDRFIAAMKADYEDSE